MDDEEATQVLTCELFIKSLVKAQDLAYIKVTSEKGNEHQVLASNVDVIENANIRLEFLEQTSEGVKFRHTDMIT